MTDEQLGGKKCTFTLVNESIKIQSYNCDLQHYQLVIIKPRHFIRSSRIAKRTYIDS
jgi:hypothetical protein